jgi:hypothetical protein
VKVGDLIIRRIHGPGQHEPDWKRSAAINQRELLGCGIVLSKAMAGNPKHPCVTVFYPKAGKSYRIAESLVEVINETG